MTDKTPAEISLRAFARQMEVNESTIRKAIRSGRLERCIAYRNGLPVIADAALAAREWHANYDPTAERRR